MTFDEYVALAQRTASTKTNADKVGHGCLGLIGEAGEVVDIVKKMTYMGMTDEMGREKLIDEIGDCCWYIAEWCTGSGNDMQAIFDRAANASSIDDRCSLANYAVHIAEIACELWEEIDVGMVDNDILFADVRTIAAGIKKICYKINVTLEEVLEHNIEKLKKRYPEGFSADRSNVRYEQ